VPPGSELEAAQIIILDLEEGRINATREDDSSYVPTIQIDSRVGVQVLRVDGDTPDSHISPSRDVTAEVDIRALPKRPRLLLSSLTRR
jgi:hypothetical protein